MTQNAINNIASTFSVGNSTENNLISIERSAEGQWLGMDDQTDTFGIYNSMGTPEGGVAANIGSVATDTTNGILYIKQTDTVNTGWSPIGGNSGTVVQTTSITSAAFTSTTATIPADDTIPQNTEGTELITLAITPKNASNILNISYNGMFGTSAVQMNIVTALFQDATADALHSNAQTNTNLALSFKELSVLFSMVAGTTSSTTFKIRYGTTFGTVAVNGLPSGRFFGGTSLFALVIQEVLP